MANHTSESKSSNGAINLVVGIVLVAVGFLALNKSIDVATGITINPGETVSMIGVLLILFPVIKTFYTQPLGDAIHQRNADLERTFTEAEQLKADMQTLRSDYERRLADTEAQAREQIQAQIREAQQLRQTLTDEAAAKANAFLAQAQAEISAERDRLIGDLRSHVVDIALDAAEKVVRENMDTERNRRMIEDFINRAEVAV